MEKTPDFILQVPPYTERVGGGEITVYIIYMWDLQQKAEVV